MARINIEDKLFTDPRFEILCKKVSKEVAIGKLVLAWRSAQMYYEKGENIPADIFEMMEFMPLVESKFAVYENGGYYLHGTKESFQWLEKKRDAGKKGGETKAENAKAKASIALADASTCQADDKQPSSETYPLTLTPSLSPTLSPDLTQDTKLNTNARKKKKTPAVAKFDLEAVYALFPKKEGKTKGLEKLARLIQTPEDYARLLNATRNYCFLVNADRTEYKFIKHFSTFASCWEDYESIVIPKTASQETATEHAKNLMANNPYLGKGNE